MSIRTGRLARSARIWTLAIASGAGPGAFLAIGQGTTPVVRPRLESIAGTDGQARFGRVTGDPTAGFRFEPIGGGPAQGLEHAGAVTFEGPRTDATAGYPPMRVLLGLDQRISGRLGTVDGGSIRLEDGPGGAAVVVSRPGAIALSQRPGEALVIQEGFEALDPRRWDEVGDPEVVAEPHLVGERALRLGAGGRR